MTWTRLDVLCLLVDPVHDVFLDGHVEQLGFLTDNCNVLEVLVHINVGNVDVIDENLSRLLIVETLQQRNDG